MHRYAKLDNFLVFRSVGATRWDAEEERAINAKDRKYGSLEVVAKKQKSNHVQIPNEKLEVKITGQYKSR